MSELITINTEKIIDDFDEDYLISTIKLFLEETYVDNLNKMEEGYKNKDKSEDDNAFDNIMEENLETKIDSK